MNIPERFALCSCRKIIFSNILKRYSSNNKSEKFNHLLDLNAKSRKNYNVNEVTKKDLEWPKPWNEETEHYFKTLRVFYTDKSKVEIARFLQSPIDFRPSTILNWIKRKEREKEIILQSYIPERNQVLGNELAAAHFVVYRGGAIKFHGGNNWIKANEDGDYDLPSHYVNSQYIEAIDCSEMTLYYEGLTNLSKLQRINWLSFNGCENIDDWSVDYISGIFYKTLVYLDLRNCPSITERGLTALWKMENLKVLYLDDVLRSSEYEMTILMLQEHLPHLEILVGDYCD
ncbi:hypothetical protein WA026_013770 [Henosepilachna vigintioctopunctata]|uniref:ATP synthase subunit s-like protein n=1 Tax=Henosepilachna vigintioctopunctata TaxID=420089 RepID=A0AAW1UQU5_9CUCU